MQSAAKSMTDLSIWDEIKILREESRSMCVHLDRDLELRIGLWRETFRLLKHEARMRQKALKQSVLP